MGRAPASTIMFALAGRLADTGAVLNFLVENTAAADTVTGIVSQTQGRGIAGFAEGNTFRGMLVQHTIRSPSSTITGLFGVVDRIDVHSAADGSSDADFRYGYYFEANPDPGAANDSGTIANTYGCYVEDIAFPVDDPTTTSTVRYAFYSVADPSRFPAVDMGIVAKTSAYSATNSDHVITCDASGGAFTVTLPDTNGRTGRVYHIKKTDSSGNAVTVDGDGSQTIDGSTTKAISVQYDSIMIVSDGSNWHII